MTDYVPEIGHYAYLRNMSIEGWTWEFTRRNPSYRIAWQPYSLRRDTSALPKGIIEIDKEEIAAASRFGLLFFR